MVLIRALGPLEVLDARGAPVDLGGRQPRLVLAALLTGGGRAIPVDTLVDAVWGEDPPASAVGTLQSYVSRLRRRTGDGFELRLDDAGYRLLVDPDCVDTERFVRLADEGRAALDAGRPADARRLLTEADALWRGPALAEVADLDIGRGAATRLEERRLSAIEDRIDADLALGRHGALASELVPLVDQHPLREKLREQLATALYRAGRQAEALRALADAGAVLREQLGIEPSRPLRELETRILNHDSSLDLAGRAAPVAVEAPTAAMAGNAFVGRADELAQLVAALDESTAAARFAVIEGEPGIGKTRLADELRAVATARGAVAVWGRADESGAAPALWPWLVVLRTLAQRIGEVPEALAEVLTGQTPVARTGIVSEAADALQYERFEAVADVLSTVAAGAPLVVLLDDIQWADRASLDLLTFLSGRLEGGVLIVVTVRQLEVGRNDDVTTTLATIARRPGSRRLTLSASAASRRRRCSDSMPPAVSASSWRPPCTLGPKATRSTRSSSPACSGRKRTKQARSRALLPTSSAAACSTSTRPRCRCSVSPPSSAATCRWTSWLAPPARSSTCAPSCSNPRWCTGC